MRRWSVAKVCELAQVLQRLPIELRQFCSLRPRIDKHKLNEIFFFNKLWYILLAHIISPVRADMAT